MTAAEQRERDARVCDEVARRYRDKEAVWKAAPGNYAVTKAQEFTACAEVAEECARQIRAGEVA